MNNQKGFALIYALFLLPFCLGLISFLFAINFWLIPQYRNAHICRTELLKTQSKASKNIQKILDLNSKVFLLRTLRRSAEISYAASLLTYNPIIIGAALSNLNSIKASQAALAIFQKSIILKSNLELNQQYSKIILKLIEENNKYKDQVKSQVNSKIIILPTFLHHLAIKEKNEKISGPPIYELETDFTRKQSLSINWKQYFSINTEGQLKWIGLENNLTKNQSCKASILEDKKQLNPVLIADKF